MCCSRLVKSLKVFTALLCKYILLTIGSLLHINTGYSQPPQIMTDTDLTMPGKLS